MSSEENRAIEEPRGQSFPLNSKCLTANLVPEGGGGLETLPTTPSARGGSVIEVSDVAVSWNVVGVGAQG